MYYWHPYYNRYVSVGAAADVLFPRPAAGSPAAQQVPRPGGAASVLLPGTQGAEQVPGGVRQRYETAEARTKRLLEQYAMLLNEAKVSEGRPRLNGNPVAMRVLAPQLDAAGLHPPANNMRRYAQMIEDARAQAPAPGGGPLQAPGKVSPLATTRGAWVPGMSFIVKIEHFNDMDGDKKLQTFVGHLIPAINSAIGLGVVPYTDPTLHSTYTWTPLFDETLGRQVSWNLVNIEAGSGGSGVLQLPTLLLQIPGFQKMLETVWVVPNGTPVFVLRENLPRPGSPLLWARVRFQLPWIGGGPLGTQEGAIPMQDLVRRMEY